MNLTDLSTVRHVMERFGISTKKKYGQNFLINAAIPERIAEEGTGGDACGVLEIGPGIGTLTTALAKRVKKVVAVEIDDGLIPVLDYTLAEFDNVTVIHGDILKTPLLPLLREHFADCEEVYVCANLPYYITSDIIMYLVESQLPFRALTVMVQKEFADRIVAQPGSKEYGAVSAAVQYYGKAQKLFKVAPGNFLPAPKVDSAVLRIDLYREKPVQPKHEVLFRYIIRLAFEQRRKTLLNALAGKVSVTKQELTEILIDLSLPADVRGERLSLAQFAEIADRIGQRF
ncbi:MAG: 16S rRNA (adenine(1518)-N(6)/adenine(1519)-N(6))-dimethyltransferase RsmA [Ruminococcaceae bacterium]|nr:16S rRNA (adenine(1518)-N(6)/adenine(1519)-N(6))-dimethyltransferase RsmA [Oscillospiraceae bacterium]